jgi:plastocyanin
MTSTLRKLTLLGVVLALTVAATAAINARLTPAVLAMPVHAAAVTFTDGAWKWADAKKGVVKGSVTFSARRPRQPMVIYLVRQGADGKPGEQGLYDVPREIVVSQRGAMFEPRFAVLVRKQKVKFLNDEKKEISHNVYFLGDVEADLGIFDRGESREHAFDGAGEVSVHCSIHKRMDAKFFVAPSPAFAVLAADASSFEIKGVPVGKYTLYTWQKQRRFRDFRTTVDVTDGEAASVTVKMER